MTTSCRSLLVDKNVLVSILFISRGSRFWTFSGQVCYWIGASFHEVLIMCQTRFYRVCFLKCFLSVFLSVLPVFVFFIQSHKIPMNFVILILQKKETESKRG